MQKFQGRHRRPPTSTIIIFYFRRIFGPVGFTCAFSYSTVFNCDLHQIRVFPRVRISNMAAKNVDSPTKIIVRKIEVQNNPSCFLAPYWFRITFECTADLMADLSWSLIFAGSPLCREFDQLLGTERQPSLKKGVHTFPFYAEGPDPNLIPPERLDNGSILFLTVYYDGQESASIGFYVATNYQELHQTGNPPVRAIAQKLERDLLAIPPYFTPSSMRRCPPIADKSEEAENMVYTDADFSIN